MRLQYEIGRGVRGDRFLPAHLRLALGRFLILRNLTAALLAMRSKAGPVLGALEPHRPYAVAPAGEGSFCLRLRLTVFPDPHRGS